MSAYPCNPYLLDNVFIPNSTNFFQFQDVDSSMFDTNHVQEISYLQDSTKVITSNDFGHESRRPTCFGQRNNVETSVTYKQSPASSSVVLDHNLESVDQKVSKEVKKRKSKNGTTSPNSAQSKDARDMVKGKKQKRSNGSETKQVVEEKKPRDEAPVGYIHVRARRGQATDSHSLAERVRREKISERMKMLQALVPGCDKVTGKALMLDEIINYVQSLQSQVEFLSMKLASMNPMLYDFGLDMDAFMLKPNQTLSSLVPPAMQDVQESSPICANSTITAFTNNYPIDGSASLMCQQDQIANILFSQGNGQLLWDVEEQRQKLINQSAFSSNNNNNFLSSFH